MNSLSALTSIFYSTHLLEEITRLTLETKRAEVIREMRDEKRVERRDKVLVCVCLSKGQKKSTRLVQGIITKITSGGSQSPFGMNLDSFTPHC